MQEQFDLNKKSAPGDGYRKNLADKLRGVSEESGFDKARGEVFSEQHNEMKVSGKNQYEKEKIEQRAQWIISKYLSEPDLFKLDDTLSLDERQNRIDEILDKKIEELQGKGVAEEYKEDVYKLVRMLVKENDFENNPNLEHFKREHSDIILQKEGENKFILIARQDDCVDENTLIDIVLESANPRDANEKDALDCIKWLLGFECTDESSKIKYLTKMLFRRSIKNNIIIARPMTSTVFNQHYQLNDKFQREHKDYTEDIRRFDGYKIKDPSLIFGEDNKEEMENFVKGFIQIIENETEYMVAMEKLKNLSRPSGFRPTYTVLGGGYVKLNEDGTFTLNGKSEVYGYLFSEYEKEEALKNTLNKDFKKEEFKV